MLLISVLLGGATAVRTNGVAVDYVHITVVGVVARTVVRVDVDDNNVVAGVAVTDVVWCTLDLYRCLC